MKKLWWIVVVVLIVVILGSARMRRLRQKNRAPLLRPVPTAVRTAPVTMRRVARSEHVLGTVIGDDEIALAPRVMAQVLAVNVREGAVVHAGDVLVRLDPREFDDAVAAARAAAEAARLAWETQRDATARDSVLFAAQAIAQEQWDRSRSRRAAARAAWTAARSRLDQARTRRGYTVLTAPVDGVVVKRLADPGNLAVPGRPLLELVRQGSVRVQAKVPPEDLTLLRVGQAARLTLGDTVVTAAVSRFAPALDRDHLALLEIDLPAPPPGFVAGATVGVDLELSSAVGLSVPADALLEGERETVVFKVQPGEGEAPATLQPVPVRVLDRSADAAVVTGDLQTGDRVVVARPSRLMTFTAGSKVMVAGDHDRM